MERQHRRAPETEKPTAPERNESAPQRGAKRSPLVDSPTATVAPAVIGRAASTRVHRSAPGSRPVTTGSQPRIQRQLIQAAVPAAGDQAATPKITTSSNFDTNHLTDDPVTSASALARLESRQKRTNTLVNSAAFTQQAKLRAAEVIAGVAADAVTHTTYTKPAEAMQARSGGAMFSSDVGIKARNTSGGIEIHHLHEAEVEIHQDDFPALGSSGKTP